MVDVGYERLIPKPEIWHLKSVQDLVALSVLQHCEDESIAEIGGGASRLLPFLAKRNQCANIEEFRGENGGPSSEIVIENVENISTKIGEFSELVESESFDTVFSISVVEHVGSDRLKGFFRDCHRILRPGGIMCHLIDIYLEDVNGDNRYASSRIELYREPFETGLFEAKGDLLVSKEAVFSTRYVTNPDNVMMLWNRSAPHLVEKRQCAQSCSLLMLGVKI